MDDRTPDLGPRADAGTTLIDLWADDSADAFAPFCTLGTSSSVSTFGTFGVCVACGACGGSISSSC